MNKDQSSLKSILSLIEFLEDVVECMFIYENELNEEIMRNKPEDISPNNEDDAEEMIMTDMRKASNTVLSNTYYNVPDPSLKKKNKSKIEVRSTLAMKKPGKGFTNENTQFMAELCCKLRTTFLLHISMVLLSFLIKKFEYIRPLLKDLRDLMNNTHQKVNGSAYNIETENIMGDNLRSLANIQIYLKNLKEITNAKLSSVKRNQGKNDVLNPEYSDEEDANDPFLRNFKQEEDDEMKQKKKKEEESQKSQETLLRKMDEFLILWMRQIVIYNTHFVLHLALTSNNVASILDIKPSIVKATNIKYALTSLMNPRLQSYQQVNNFKSMKRILDSIVTYFFQNFISVKERGLIMDDLKKIMKDPSKMRHCKYLDFGEFFESEEEFKHFYDFMDMNYYTSNVKDFELSLIQHSNQDYDQSTLERVYNVYKDGVQIYRSPGNNIRDLCFDS
jgi:hypothetical protein